MEKNSVRPVMLYIYREVRHIEFSSEILDKSVNFCLETEII